MDPALVAETFARLPSNDSRHRALDALVAQLTPYEWRRLHAITSARSFNFDIVARLPLELLILVFAYLDISAPYRLQRVSFVFFWPRMIRVLLLITPSRFPDNGITHCGVPSYSGPACIAGSKAVRAMSSLTTMPCAEQRPRPRKHFAMVITALSSSSSHAIK